MIPRLQEEEITPEGWKGDEPKELRRARTTGCTLHLTSQVVKENRAGSQSRRMEGEQEIPEQGEEAGKGKAPKRHANEGT